LQSAGMNHGGHDERDMATLDARLNPRDPLKPAAAGGIVFSWLTSGSSTPGSRSISSSRGTHPPVANVMDAEQGYGLVANTAGDVARPLTRWRSDRWQALASSSAIR